MPLAPTLPLPRPGAFECWPPRVADAECRIGTRPPPSFSNGAKERQRFENSRPLKSDTGVALSVLSVVRFYLESMTSQDPGSRGRAHDALPGTTTTPQSIDTAIQTTIPVEEVEPDETALSGAFCLLAGVASCSSPPSHLRARACWLGAEFGDSEGHHRGSETVPTGWRW